MCSAGWCPCPDMHTSQRIAPIMLHTLSPQGKRQTCPATSGSLQSPGMSLSCHIAGSRSLPRISVTLESLLFHEDSSGPAVDGGIWRRTAIGDGLGPPSMSFHGKVPPSSIWANSPDGPHRCQLLMTHAGPGLLSSSEPCSPQPKVGQRRRRVGFMASLTGFDSARNGKAQV